MIGLEGRTLNDFLLRHLLGRGGMADVYLAYDDRNGREVAIKVFKREDEDLLRRFVREARLMASLHNSHLMPVYDTGVALIDGIQRYYIVMPYLDGGTLRSRIRQGPLPLNLICAYIRSLASALDYVHSQGIIHRDIKSSNVLLDSDGHCYLSDFGIARTSSDVTQVTTTGNVLGTVDYVAPELFEPDYKADARSDFYSLGVLLYEMVTGRLPFIGANQLAIVTMHVGKRPPLPSSFVPDLPPAVEQVLLKALSKDPSQRYQDATSLARAFCQATHAPYQTAPGQASAAALTPLHDGPVRTPDRKSPLVLSAASSSPSPVRQAPLDEATIGFRQSPSFVQGTPVVPPVRSTSLSRKRGRIVSVIALLTLLAVLGPVIYSLVIHPSLTSAIPSSTSSPTSASVHPTSTPTNVPTATPNMTATAHALSLTATAQAVQATAKAIAGMTATVQAQVSATVGVVQTAVSQPSTYTDPLTDANGQNTLNAQWDDDSRSCLFSSDGYHVVTDLLNSKGCREKANLVANGTISVDEMVLSGSAAGIFFHVNTDFANDFSGYLFEVDTMGNYRLLRSDNYTTHEVTLTQGKVPKSWKSGYHVKNTLQLIIKNGTTNLYANMVYLTSMNDASYPTGTIGFVASKSLSDQPGEAVYSNLKVYP